MRARRSHDRAVTAALPITTYDNRNRSVIMRARPDEDHELLCELTDEEVGVKGNQLAEAEAVYSQTEADKAAAMKAFGTRLETARGRMRQLGAEVLTRTERRAVPCRWKVETDESGSEVWVLRRQDTFKVLQYQPVTAADRQLELLQGGAN